MANVYGNAIDLQNARNSLAGNPGYNFIDTSAQGYTAPTAYNSNDVVVGGTGAVGGVTNSGNAIRLAGSDRTGTASAISNYANSLNQPVQASGPNISSMIQSQSDSNKAAAAAQLQKARDLAVSGYNTQINGLEGTYQPLRNAQDFQGAKAVNATNEQMANMGITNSGDAVTAQIQNRVGNENALNALDLSQNKDKTAFQTSIDNANNAYQQDLISSNSGIDATALQSLISQANADRTYNASQSQNTFNNGIATAGLTGSYNGAQTMQGANNAANLTGQNLQNQTAQTNLQYLPQQQADAHNQSVASANASNASASKSNAAVDTPKAPTAAETKASVQASYGFVQNKLNDWAAGKDNNGLAVDRIGKSGILDWIDTNAGDLTQSGLNIKTLRDWANKAFTWDKVNGVWTHVG